MLEQDYAALDARLRQLSSEDFETILVLMVSRAHDPGMLLRPGIEVLDQDRLAALASQFPDLLIASERAPGYTVQDSRRAELRDIAQQLALESWKALHARAANYCAERADTDPAQAASWQTEQIYHLWEAGADARHLQLDAVFRQRLRVHDEAGCQALTDAVVAAGGASDPLLLLQAGMQASEFTRDWGMAEAYLHQALQDPNLLSVFRPGAMIELGLLDFFQGRYAPAVEYFAQASALAEASGDQRTLANALMNCGIAYTEGVAQQQLPSSVLDDALACQLRALEILRELGDPSLLLRAWSNLASVYFRMAQYDDALTAYRAALALVPPDQHHIRAALINNISEVDVLEGRLVEAEAAYKEVLSIWRATGGDFELAEALVNLGDVQERQNHPDEAIATYQSATSAVESLRSRLKAEESRTSFLASRLAPYERLIGLYAARPGCEALAFETVERAKARAFIELLADRPVRPPQQVPVQLLDREKALRDALGHLYRMGVHAGTAGPAGARATSLESDLEDVYRQMRRLDAQYAGCRTVDTMPLLDVQRRLLPRQTLLEYFGAGAELGCFVITSETVHMQLLPGLATAIEDALQPVEDAILPPNAQAVGDPAQSLELYSAALAPIAELLIDCDNLTIVPHGLLHYVPLHALGAELPLLAHHRITYAPSASILLRDRPAETSTAGDGCLVLGFAGTDLRYAELEALHVAALTGGRALIGVDASVQALLAKAGSCDTLHIVCHGVFNAQAPLASGLLLAGGKLDAMTVMQQLHLQADLVVLSACDTGQAQVLRGDELMGLARAFLYAGAAAVLVTLWPVDDLATALLMDVLYRERALLSSDRAGIAEALRRAQLALRELTLEQALAAGERLRASAAADPRTAAWADTALAPIGALAGDSTDGSQDCRPYAHPFYWAAFMMVCG